MYCLHLFLCGSFYVMAETYCVLCIIKCSIFAVVPQYSFILYSNQPTQWHLLLCGQANWDFFSFCFLKSHQFVSVYRGCYIV